LALLCCMKFFLKMISADLISEIMIIFMLLVHIFGYFKVTNIENYFHWRIVPHVVDLECAYLRINYTILVCVLRVLGM
jgi:hypothetical protein